VDGWSPGGEGNLGVFVLAISGSQHNTRPSAPAAAATDSLIPTSPTRAVFVYSGKPAAVATDTQTVQRSCAESGMACSGVNYP